MAPQVLFIPRPEGGVYYFSVKEEICQKYQLFDSWVCEYEYFLDKVYLENQDNFQKESWQYKYILSFDTEGEDFYCLYDGDNFVEFGPRNNDSAQSILWYYEDLENASYDPSIYIKKVIMDLHVPAHLHPFF